MHLVGLVFGCEGTNLEFWDWMWVWFGGVNRVWVWLGVVFLGFILGLIDLVFWIGCGFDLMLWYGVFSWVWFGVVWVCCSFGFVVYLNGFVVRSLGLMFISFLGYDVNFLGLLFFFYIFFSPTKEDFRENWGYILGLMEAFLSF